MRRLLIGLAGVLAIAAPLAGQTPELEVRATGGCPWIVQADPPSSHDDERKALERAAALALASPGDTIRYGISCSVRVVALNLLGTPVPPPDSSTPPVVDTLPRPPPDTVDLIWSRDFRTFDMAELDLAFGDRRAAGWDVEIFQRERMAQDSIGLRFDYPARESCRDFTIGVNPWLGQEYREVFVRAVVRWEPHWTTILPGCEKATNPNGSNPDHKLLGARVRNWDGSTSGAERFGLLMGNGYGERIIYGAPGVDQDIFAGSDARPLYDGRDHEIWIYARVSSAPGVPDGAAGLWVDGELLGWKDGLQVERRGIYAVYLSRNLNQGPAAPQSMWWREVEVYDRIPARLATSER